MRQAPINELKGNHSFHWILLFINCLKASIKQNNLADASFFCPGHLIFPFIQLKKRSINSQCLFFSASIFEPEFTVRYITTFFLGHTQDVYFSALGYETHRVWGSKLIGFTLHFYICHLGLRCIFFFISLTSTVSSGRVLRRGRPGSIVLAGGSPCSCE